MSDKLALEAREAAQQLMRRCPGSGGITRVINADGNVNTLVDNNKNNDNKERKSIGENTPKSAFQSLNSRFASSAQTSMPRGPRSSFNSARPSSASDNRSGSSSTGSNNLLSDNDLARIKNLCELIPESVTEMRVTHWVADGRCTFFAIRQEAFKAKRFIEHLADRSRRVNTSDNLIREGNVFFLFDNNRVRRVRILNNNQLFFMDSGEKRVFNDKNELELCTMPKELLNVPKLAMELRLNIRVSGVDFFNAISKFDSVGVRALGLDKDGVRLVEVLGDDNCVIDFGANMGSPSKDSKPMASKSPMMNSSKVMSPKTRSPVMSPPKTMMPLSKEYGLEDLPKLWTPKEGQTEVVLLAALTDTIDVIYFHLYSKLWMLELPISSPPEPNSRRPSLDSLVLIKKEDAFTRAQIKAHLPNNALKVFLIDHGIYEEVNTTYVLPSDLTNVPALALKMRLKGVTRDAGFGSEEIRADVLEEMADNKFKVTVTQAQSEIVEVTLRKRDERYFLTTYKCLTMPHVISDDMRLVNEEKYLPADFEAKILDVSEAELQLILILESNLVFQDMIELVAKDAFDRSNQSSFKPSNNDIVIGKIKGQYCRCRILEFVNENVLRCERIDVGDEVRLPLNKVFPLLKCLEDLPPLAQKCRFTDYSDMDYVRALYEDIAEKDIGNVAKFKLVKTDDQGISVVDYIKLVETSGQK